MGQLDGKVAYITGAARGQGRSHAELLAAEGADIIGIDLCDQIDSVEYAMSTPEDLQETRELIERQGRQMLAVEADVRDQAAQRRAFEAGLKEFGHVDIVLANAGIMAMGMPPYENSEQAWKDSLDVMITGVWNTLQVAAPHLVENEDGGSIVITSSTVGLRWTTTNFDGGHDGYGTSKWALVGLMRAYAGKLAPANVRVNTVHPTGVNTPMVANDFFQGFADAHPELMEAFANALPVATIEPIDVSRVILFLVSDAGRYFTGQTVGVDAGQTTVPPIGQAGTVTLR